MSNRSQKYLPIVIKERLYIRADDLSEEALSVLFDEFTYKNPERFKLQNLGYSTRGVPRFISSVQERGNKIVISRGCKDRVENCLQDYLDDRRIKWIDRTLFFSGDDLLPAEYAGEIEMSFARNDINFRDDQYGVVHAIVNNPIMVVDAVCSAGKTEIGLFSISRLRQPTIILVHTVEPLMRQWIAAIMERFDLPEKEVGALGDSKSRLRPITVSTIQTMRNRIKKEPDIVKRFGMVILDEGHHAPASTFQEVIEKFPARYRINVTGSLKRKDGKTFLIHDLFGEVKAKITDEELVEKGAVLPVKVYALKTGFYYDYRNKDLIEKLDAEGAFDHLVDENDLPLEGAERTREIHRYLKMQEIERREWTDFLDVATGNRKRNDLIVDVMEMLYQRGETTIILSARRKHCRILKKKLKRRGIRAGLLLGGKESREMTSKNFKQLDSGKLLVGIGTSIADEALNIRRLVNVIVTCTGAGNESKIKQQGGRTKRLFKGKIEARLIYLWDYLIQHFAPDAGRLRRIFKNTTVVESVVEMEKLFGEANQIKAKRSKAKRRNKKRG